jgi:hypothetical protein
MDLKASVLSVWKKKGTGMVRYRRPVGIGPVFVGSAIAPGEPRPYHCTQGKVKESLGESRKSGQTWQ